MRALQDLAFSEYLLNTTGSTMTFYRVVGSLILADISNLALMQ